MQIWVNSFNCPNVETSRKYFGKGAVFHPNKGIEVSDKEE